MLFKETALGYEHSTKDYIVFFGNKNCTKDSLIKNYPALAFREIKQTHSDILIQSTEDSAAVEADAHWTSQKNIGLLIKTADCIPALIYTPKVIVAIHAGWRGVANQITKKSLLSLKLKMSLDVFLGPHIRQDSFEVSNDAYDLLMPNPHIDESAYPLIFQKKSDKYHIDLESLLISQILSTGAKFHVESLKRDTVKDLRFNSYRRDKQTNSRNLSFIALR